MKLRKEIGSEFWEIPTKTGKNGLFPVNTYWFISGRSALQAIIKDIKNSSQFHTVAMPDWCCDSMILPFIKENIKVVFYQALNPINDINTDAVLIMDYFGYTGNSELINYNGIVIRDLTHSIFSREYNDADYYFGSLRKWAGLWTGGYAWGFKHSVHFEKDEKGYGALRKKSMQAKKNYITMQSDCKEYLHDFDDAEEILDDVGILPGSDRDIYLAERFDVEKVKSIRRKNGQILLSEFSDIALFPKFSDQDCPMFVPIKINNRNELRQFLIQNEIYCPVHWPNTKYHNMSKATKEIVDKELSLVCDQRYDSDDMFRLIETVKKYGR